MYSFKLPIINQDVIESLLNDFELVKTIYSDSIKVYENTDALCDFKINLKYHMEVEESIREIIMELKFDELIKDKEVVLPYSIQFHLDSSYIVINLNCFWMKKEIKHLDSFHANTVVNEESGFFNIIENFKMIISAPEKPVLINWLQKMKEELIITNGKILGNYLIITQMIRRKRMMI